MAENELTLAQYFREIEPKWQSYWQTHHTFKAAQPGQAGSEKPKYYVLDMFPYPSGEGLHVGHPLGYVATDIFSRYKRMKGFNVLHPMGWDAFGLPAEQYAIQKGIHPSETTQKNILTYKRQLNSLGLSYDWSREVNTTDPSYYRWTQWIFKKLVERGLAYQANIAVNWCPALGTVLANDEIIDGKSERGGHPVERKPMRQWLLKITDYADRLLADLEKVDWPESTKQHQRNWIGKSEGARIKFNLHEASASIEVFTTRPDTLFGVSFLALAPEHSLVEALTSDAQREAVRAYVKAAARKSDLQRTDLAKSKSGVFLGAYAKHPLSGEKIPVWVADYILVNYGTGAIMGVPAHDERDLEFAQTLNLKILPVISEEDTLINSGTFSGLSIEKAVPLILEDLQAKGAGSKAITYKLRDWLFARQRYWGEPIPVIHVLEGPDKGAIRLLADDELPLLLPPVDRYEPTGTGESPLSSVASWVNVKDPQSGAAARRETNTMPGSAGSSWYFLRFMDPHNSTEAFSQSSQKYWNQVDLYVGGAEHAVGHLLYARLWTKVLFDMGLLSFDEPFKRLVHQGMILASDGEKMSKSRGNVVNPDEVIHDYGADTFRLFEMFLGPLEKAKPWQTQNIEGVYRFLQKVWRLATEQSHQLSKKVVEVPESQWPADFVQLYHKTIKQVGDDLERLQFNTATSALMILVNGAQGLETVPRTFLEGFSKLLSPFAPHLAEEIWKLLGHTQSIGLESWPAYDATKVSSDEVQLAIQVNGKLRDNIKVSKEIGEKELSEKVLSMESILKWTEGKTPKKFIYVKGKLVSVVV